MDTKALMVMPTSDMMERVKEAKWSKDLTSAESKIICDVAISYGLDPIMQELMIYQGTPYVTINGRYRKAQESGYFDGIDTRPATKQEREDRSAKEGDYLYRCEVFRKDARHPFVGWGRVRVSETQGNANLPIVKDPDRQCEKRAEAMALRKAFSMPLPIGSWEEVEESLEQHVDTGTGEIIESTAVEVPELDETPIDKGQSDYLLKLCEEKGVTKIQLGKWMREKPREWKVQTFGDVKKWQYDVTVANAFTKEEEPPEEL